MAEFKTARTKKIRYRIWHFILWPFAIILVTQPFWLPFFDQWRCERIASELEQQYSLVVRFGDPSEFYVPPLNAQVNKPSEGIFIGRADKHSAFIALKGIQVALRKYPKDLLREYLTAVFVSGKITIHGVAGGGTYRYKWIYIVALDEFKHNSPALYEQSFHHELSSLFFKGARFPSIRWHLANEPDFNYLPKQKDVVRAASPENRRDPKEAPSWYRAGFVHDYGMASMENDFNMYAELAMTHPEQLKKLADQYPLIQAKTWILVDFYSSLAPELGEYLASAGLTKMPGLTQAHEERKQ